MKIVHIITTLDDGGAEHTLFKICKYDKLNNHVVISFKKNGKYYKLLKELGIKVFQLNLKYYTIHKIFSIIKILKSTKPDLIQTWLIHGDLIGGIVAKLIGIHNVVWNVRHSDLKIRKTKFSTILISKFLSKLSYSIPKLIIINSLRAKKIYEKNGYDKKKLKFVPNGYDLKILKPDTFKKINLKKKLKIRHKVPLIGNVGRYDPKKDHLNLLNALSIIKSKNLDFYCILLGLNIDQNNSLLVSQIKRLKLNNNVKLLGTTKKISNIMNGLDVYVQSSSFGEGFPNVVAESMSCGTPCIVTDVGDASSIVKGCGWVVPANNSEKLAIAIEKAISEIYSKKWRQRCINSRKVIKKKI